MEDRQQFIDGLTQLRANAGLGNWIVEEVDLDFVVYELGHEDAKCVRAITDYEDVADFIATTHAVIPELVEVIGSALDEADRLDSEKDDLIAQIFELEVEADRRDSDIDELREDIRRLEEEVDDLNGRNYEVEEENSDLRDQIQSLQEELTSAVYAE